MSPCSLSASITKTPSDRKQLLILGPKPYHQYDLITLEVILHIRNLFSTKGWIIHYEYSDEITEARPGPFINHLLKIHQHSRWLLLEAPFPILQWCETNKLRYVCQGGMPAPLSPPFVSFEVTHLLEKAISLAIQHGHRSISILLLPKFKEFDESLRQKTARIFEQHNIPFHPNYNMPLIPHRNAACLTKTIHSLFKISPPSLLIVTEPEHLGTVYSYCMSQGLRIPQDLSTIALFESKEMEWFVPEVTHLKVSTKAMVKKLALYIESYPTTPSKPTFLPPILKKGASLRDITHP